MATEGFPIVGLKGSPSSRKTLNDMTSRCRRMPESEKLCTRVLERLKFLHDAVAPLENNDAKSPKAMYINVVVRFVSLTRRKPFLLRLASSESLLLTIKGLQDKLSSVGQALGLGDKPEMTMWNIEWESDKAEHYTKLAQLVPAASESSLVNEFRGDKKVKEALFSLNRSIQGQGQTDEMVTMKRNTFNRVSGYSHQEGLRMFDWFIPIDDVEYEDEAIGVRGTFGDVCRGVWLHDGQRTEVAIKRLFQETSSDSDDAFLRQLQLWVGLPPNEHILKLYGGSHVSKPQFYVCEKAGNGNIGDFLEDETNSVMFWRLFKQVAQGLQFLHDNHTVHGGLKCNNILVDGNYKAKLADFGFSTVRTLSAGLSGNADKANAQSVRWKPKEVLKETGLDAPHYESDVYSLAMCMIEAKTHEPPFGMDDDLEVIDKIMKGASHPRPDEFSDEEWSLISRMCNPDFTQRPQLDQVLREISVFADTEKQLRPIARSR